MRRDPGSSYQFTLVEAQNSLAPGTNTSTGLDHKDAPYATYLIYVNSVGTGGTLDVKLQYSADNSAWTDEPDDVAKNEYVIAQITAVGLYTLDVPNPRARYTRVHCTGATDTVAYSVIACAGPILHIES